MAGYFLSFAKASSEQKLSTDSPKPEKAQTPAVASDDIFTAPLIDVAKGIFKLIETSGPESVSSF